MGVMRIPVIQRTPFVRERQKVQRKPVISRSPIVTRTPIVENCDTCEKCRLFSQLKDCGDNLYVAPEDLKTDMHIPRLFVITKDTNQEELVPLVEALEKAGKFLRVVTNVPLSRELITATSYSVYNVLQHSIDLSKSQELFEKLKDSLFMARNYGAYTTAVIAPIIPGVTKIAKVLGVINRITPSCAYFGLKFMVSSKTKNVDGVYLVNGNAVDGKYLVETKNGLECSQEFIQYYTDTVASYTMPKKINICICNAKTCY